MLAVYQNGNYHLQDDRGRETGRLVKEGFFTCKVSIQTPEEQLNFVKRGLFSSTKINRNGLEIGEVKQDWKSLNFKLDVGSRIHQYRLCHKSIWNSTFKLTNELKEELLYIVPQFKWRKMNYDYRIEVVSKSEQINTPSMLLLAVYGVRKLLEHQYAAA
jgi:hypothetical protein